jgi:hypothetical protein
MNLVRLILHPIQIELGKVVTTGAKMWEQNFIKANNRDFLDSTLSEQNSNYTF